AARKSREQALKKSAGGRWEEPSDVGDPWAQNAKGKWSLPKPRLPHKAPRQLLTRRFDRLETATRASTDQEPPWANLETKLQTKLESPISRAGALVIIVVFVIVP
ncbi:unnamed protein product, partial [Prorocentrum cordatum]